MTYVPGERMLRPPVVIAAGAILINDVVLKPRFPGVVSGKLSDVAIAVLLPVAIASAWEWGRWLAGRREPLGPRGVALACAAAGAYFAALQLVPAAARLHVDLLGALVPGASFAVTPDPTDLYTLAVLPWTWWWACRASPGATLPASGWR